MASERDKAKEAITDREGDDPEFSDVMTAAHELRLKVIRENSRHKEVMKRHDLGILGRFLGGEASAPITVAFIGILFGLFVAAGCWAAALYHPDDGEFWSKQAERGM